MIKYILAWFPMVLVAIGNGLFREKVLSRYFNELHAHQLSTISFIFLFGCYVYGIFKIKLPMSTEQTVMIGLLWLAMTILFEFLFGHYIAGYSWEKLLHDYNIFEGRLWLLVLMWILISPYLIYQFLK